MHLAVDFACLILDNSIMLSAIAFNYFASLYNPDFCAQIVEFCKEGRSPEAFAASVNCTPEVFGLWAKDHPEFECALHIAIWKSYAWWELEAMENKNLNATIYKTIMAHRFNWKDNIEEIQRAVRMMNDEELEVMAKRLLLEGKGDHEKD